MSSSLNRGNSDREPNNNINKCPSDQSEPGRSSTSGTQGLASGTNQQIICHITTADNHVYQVQVDQKSEACQVLTRICKMLGIMDECEYFGLQYFGKQRELLWLNLRNQLSKQIHGSTPYALFLKVKYFVQPQRLIQEETKRQFFLNIVSHFQKGEWINVGANYQMIGEMIALMTHTNCGSFNQTTTPCKYACFWPESRGEIPNETLKIAANFHHKLNDQNQKSTQYEVMRRAHSSLDLYGTHFFDVTHMYGKPMRIGIGPEKLFICHTDGSLVEEVVYARLHMVYLSTKIVTLRVLDDSGQAKERQYELKTRSLAQSMYRCITEIHAFFKSDNISAQVMEQTTNRNVLPDSITSLFQHSPKEFAFDVTKTAQEVYDQALRRAYQLSQVSSAHNREHFFSSKAVTSPRFCLPGDSPSPPMISSGNQPSTDRRRSPTVSSNGSSTSDISSQVEEVIQEELKSRTLCQYCCSEEITRVFTPCGHAVCCKECSIKVEECPVCRASIETRQIFFPPWSNANCHTPSSLAGVVLQRAHNASHGESRVPHHHHHHYHLSHSANQPDSRNTVLDSITDETRPESGVKLRNRPKPSLDRQCSLSFPSCLQPTTHDPRRIRTYSDFRETLERGNNPEPQLLPLIPPSLDLAEHLEKERQVAALEPSSPRNDSSLGHLCVTISSSLLSESHEPCSGDMAPTDPPACVASGVPSGLSEQAFHMDDSATHTPLGRAGDQSAPLPTSPVETNLCSGNSPFLNSIIHPAVQVDTRKTKSDKDV